MKLKDNAVGILIIILFLIFCLAQCFYMAQEEDDFGIETTIKSHGDS